MADTGGPSIFRSLKIWSKTVSQCSMSEPRIALCLIVKNEAENIGPCIKPVVDLVDEVVVIDTGSTDATIRAARQLGAHVYTFPWCDDFSAARNQFFEHTAAKWIFWLDADDRIDNANRLLLQELFATLGDANKAYRMRTLCLFSTSPPVVVNHERLFRNHPSIRWRYRVHEQILPSLIEQGAQLHDTKIVIRHTGYQDRIPHRAKLERDLRLMEIEKTEQPDDPFVLFNLGRAYIDLRRPDEALACLHQSLSISDSGVRWQPPLPWLYRALAHGYRQNQDLKQALTTCQKGLDQCPGDPLLLKELGSILEIQGELAAAEATYWQYLEQCSVTDEASGAYHVRQRLAQMLEAQKRRDEAQEHWRAALAERMDYLPAVLGLMDSYMATNRSQEAENLVKQAVEFGEKTIPALVAQARLDMHRREFVQARSLLERAVIMAPSDVTVREALSHVFISEGQDWTAVEDALLAVLELNPEHTAAQANLQVVRKHHKPVQGDQESPSSSDQRGKDTDGNSLAS